VIFGPSIACTAAVRSTRYEPALDGVRGGAILCVLFHHFGLLPGGSLGVDAFFVLSGFLITSLLLHEWDATGTISLRLFYLRRALRLLPALGALLVPLLVFALFLLASGQSTVHQLRPLLQGIGFGAFYVANLAKAADLQLASLAHLWSLAEEEQFYFLWPVALAICLRRRVRTRSLCLVLGIGALLVASNRVALFATGSASWQRLISSPDTRADPLLVGCLAGVLYTARMLPGWSASRLLARRLWLPVAAIPVAVVALGTVSPRWSFVVGLVPFEISVAILILLALTHRDSVPSRVLQAAPLRATGKISYSLYLWHALFRAAPLPLAFGLSFAAAAASYRFVEQPFLRKKAKRRPAAVADAAEPEAPEPEAPAEAVPSSLSPLPLPLPQVAHETARS
jgi:peptidoglycan/LPS O-acetylase OafA/YrhL